MKISKSLTVINVSEPIADKNGINYKQITVMTASQKLVFNEVGQAVVMRVVPKKGTFNAWEHSYAEMLNIARKKGVELSDLTKEDLKGIAPDFAYSLKPGEKLLGDVIQRKVEAYNVPSSDGEERTVDLYSCVVLGNTAEEDQFEAEVARTFKRNGRPIQKDTIPMFKIPTTSAVEEAEEAF